MASAGTQPELAVPPPPFPISASNAQRWIDLGLVIAVAFGNSILGSIFLAFHPVAPKYSNARIVAGILAETTALLLFLTLFKRQGRRLENLGFRFRWTDLPIALGLVVAAFTAMAVMQGSINRVWLWATQHSPQWAEHRTMFTGSSVWLILPFLLLNPFFEEILV